MTNDNNDPWGEIPRGGGTFWKPEKIGDRIGGTITEIGIAQDFNGNDCPKLVLDTDDGERIVTAGQANLKSQLLTLMPRPKPGDQIRITYSSTEKAARGDKKMFTVELKAGATASDLF